MQIFQKPQLQPDLALAFLGCFLAMDLQEKVTVTINKTATINRNFIIQKYDLLIINRYFEVKLQFE